MAGPTPNSHLIADARIGIRETRPLCLNAVGPPYRGGPRLHLRITDQAAQILGAAGLSKETPLARRCVHLRIFQMGNGPGAIHRRQLPRAESRRTRTG